MFITVRRIIGRRTRIPCVRRVGILDFGAVIRETAHLSEHIIFMSDNARLLDVLRFGKEGRFLHYMVVKSAAVR